MSKFVPRERSRERYKIVKYNYYRPIILITDAGGREVKLYHSE